MDGGTETRNFLSQKKIFAVADYLKLVADRIERERPHRNVIAEWASASLGFSVTASNIKLVADSAGIDLPRAASLKGRRAYKDRVLLLAKDVVALRRELGSPVSDELMDLAGMRRGLPGAVPGRNGH